MTSTYSFQIGTPAQLIALHGLTSHERMESVAGVTIIDSVVAENIGAALASVVNPEPGTYVITWEKALTGKAADAVSIRAAVRNPADGRNRAALKEMALSAAMRRAEAEAVVAELIESLWNGATQDITEIAALTGVTRPTVYKRLRAAGIEPTTDRTDA